MFASSLSTLVALVASFTVNTIFSLIQPGSGANMQVLPSSSPTITPKFMRASLDALKEKPSPAASFYFSQVNAGLYLGGDSASFISETSIDDTLFFSSSRKSLILSVEFSSPVPTVDPIVALCNNAVKDPAFIQGIVVPGNAFDEPNIAYDAFARSIVVHGDKMPSPRAITVPDDAPVPAQNPIKVHVPHPASSARIDLLPAPEIIPVVNDAHDSPSSHTALVADDIPSNDSLPQQPRPERVRARTEAPAMPPRASSRVRTQSEPVQLIIVTTSNANPAGAAPPSTVFPTTIIIPSNHAPVRPDRVRVRTETPVTRPQGPLAPPSGVFFLSPPQIIAHGDSSPNSRLAQRTGRARYQHQHPPLARLPDHAVRAARCARRHNLPNSGANSKGGDRCHILDTRLDPTRASLRPAPTSSAPGIEYRVPRTIEPTSSPYAALSAARRLDNTFLRVQQHHAEVQHRAYLYLAQTQHRASANKPHYHRLQTLHPPRQTAYPKSKSKSKFISSPTRAPVTSASSHTRPRRPSATTFNLQHGGPAAQTCAVGPLRRWVWVWVGGADVLL
ncbi:hypothetical protein B0H13DRAFT_2272594 [Mycena leptocephala]|nr:hypothetical protein B0H13DRAFT_2272594 [Mycena leptocephala]